MINSGWTPYPEFDALLYELLSNVKAVLGGHFVGMYLEGSLATGAFDQDSDIDFTMDPIHLAKGITPSEVDLAVAIAWYNPGLAIEAIKRVEYPSGSSDHETIG